MVPSSSCSSPHEQEEYLHSLEQTDEYENDDEIYLELDQMNPIPVCLSLSSMKYTVRSVSNP